MKITLYREIVGHLREAQKASFIAAQIKLYAAFALAGFGYEAKIISASEFLKINEHLQRKNLRRKLNRHSYVGGRKNEQ